MRHRVAGRKLGRNADQRKAMRQSVTVSLFRHESITTTTAKAKEVRGFAERMITLAKKGGLANYRRALSELQDKAVVKKLFNEIAPRYTDREGGYTRVLRLSERRVNDGAEQVVFELVGDERRAYRRKAPKRPKVTARRQKELQERTRARNEAEPETEETADDEEREDIEAEDVDDDQDGGEAARNEQSDETDADDDAGEKTDA